MDGPVDHSVVGALFGITADAVVVLEGGQVVAWNDCAARLFGVPAQEATRAGSAPLGPDQAVLLGLPADGAAVVHVLQVPDTGDRAYPRVVTAVRRDVGARTVLLLRDITDDTRRERGLRRIAAVSQLVLGEDPSAQAVLQHLCGEVKALTGAAYSAVLLLRAGSDTESSHFAYDAPRHLFPERMPRAVGLLAVPIASRAAARLDDIRGHAAGHGLPGVHPPIGPLLAVPLLAGDTVIGELAAANAPGDRPFDAVDEALLVDLAAHASAVVSWALLAERERERSIVRQEVVDTARHDIRTPVGAGKGFALLLQRRRDRMTEQQVEGALQGLVDSFARIEAFSERLLLDERSASAGVLPRWEAVEVAGLMASVVRDHAAAAGGDDVVTWDADGAPTELAGDPEMVRQVLDNLIGNAVKHAGSAVVTAREEGELVRFDVRDDGPGIAEAEQAHLFDRWSRTESTRQGGVPGFGLGLAIVKRLVVAHGGTVGVSSRPGEGSTFWATFPRRVPVVG